jgi:hypothetical protein
VPAHSTVVGIPGRVVVRTGVEGPLEHGDLPDPEGQAIEELSKRLAQLESLVRAITMAKLLRRISWFLFCAGGLFAADTTFWVQPCATGRKDCLAGDEDLARWAFEAWQGVSDGKIHFIETKDRDKALIRLVWATEEQGLYGETVPVQVGNRRGAEIFVHDTVEGIKDDLLRATVVYLTCLHESGHALGLSHTSDFADIMYSFQYGGDIPEYFGRYRRKLAVKADIRKNSGISPADRQRLMELLTK